MIDEFDRRLQLDKERRHRLETERTQGGVCHCGELMANHGSDHVAVEMFNPANHVEECVSVKSAPAGFISRLLSRVETLIVIQKGRERSGVFMEDFTVRAEYTSLRAIISTDYTQEQRRQFIRSHIPLNFSVRYQKTTAVVPWVEAYPFSSPLFSDNRTPKEILDGRSLADVMAERIIVACVTRLEPDWRPF